MSLNSSKNHERPDALELERYAWKRTDEWKETITMLLSHHPPSLYGHCLRIGFRGRYLYFCGRCTGIYGGLGLGLLSILISGVILEPSWAWFLLSVGIGMATVVDWMSQRLTHRKTTNTMRFTTGLLSGLGLAVIFMLGNLIFMLVVLIVMGLSVGSVSLMETRRSKTNLLHGESELDANQEE